MHRRGKQLILALMCISTDWANAASCTVAVAANFSAPMRALVAAFHATHDHNVTLTIGSSGKFYAQISNGAPFDIFLSADQARVDALESAGLSVADSRFTYATGRLVLWTSQSGQPADGRQRLLRGEFDRIALANPRLAPYGRAAVEVLNALGAQNSKQVMGENVAQAYAFVHSGNADVGFVALSQVTRPRGADEESAGSILWRVEPHLHRPIHQDGVVLRRAADNAAARDLMTFLHSREARQIIESYGYGTDSPARSSPISDSTTGAGS